LKSLQKPSPEKRIIERLAETSNHLYCWQETMDGRKRLWCKTCKAEGREWATPEPCEHILQAIPGNETTMQEAVATLLALMNEPADSQANADQGYHPKSVPADADKNS
jgi:hypothetical protein